MQQENEITGNADTAAQAFREFVAIVRALRTPGTGCPWDLEQDHRSLRPYLVEEAYEVLDAIDRGDDTALREELGDLLLQVVLHAQLAADRGVFSIAEVVRGIAEKMIRRHPHVFGSVQVSGAAEVSRNWEQIKAAEAQAKGAASPDALVRIPESLPALLRAQRLSEKAAGSETGSTEQLFASVREKLAALESRSEAGALGEVLFGLCQLASRLGLNAEESLRACNRDFVERVRARATGKDE